MGRSRLLFLSYQVPPAPAASLLPWLLLLGPQPCLYVALITPEAGKAAAAHSAPSTNQTHTAVEP